MSHRCTIDIKLRNFRYKYLMRIMPNNKYLFKCKLAPTVLCDFCAMQEETNAHLFWDCHFVQGYWSKIQKFLQDNNCEIDLSYYRISYGILDKNSVKTPMMNFTILIAKYCIFSLKYKMQRPTFERLHQRKEAEHYIALAKDKIEQHNQKWDFWETLNRFCSCILLFLSDCFIIIVIIRTINSIKNFFKYTKK